VVKIKKKNKISKIHGELFKEQIELYYESCLG
jgi:hypothetical protein